MKNLLVFDYDWSLINTNSDTYIFQQLSPKLETTLRKLNRDEKIPWTMAMDRTLNLLYDEMIERKDIDFQKLVMDTISRVPIQDKMFDMLKYAYEVGSCDVVIISDANIIFIQSMLDYYELNSYISAIHTNKAWFEPNNKLRVASYQDLSKPHGCPQCPVNMCKGGILEEVRCKKDYNRIVYVGDGNGDFCPVTKMSMNDFVFARKGYPLLERIHRSRDILTHNFINQCVKEWETGMDLFQQIQLIFPPSQPV